MFGVGPFSDTLTVGVYIIFVDTITIGSTVYIPTGTTSFSLTVKDPCNNAVITGTAPANTSISVFSVVSPTSVFTFSYTSLIGPTACGTL